VGGVVDASPAASHIDPQRIGFFGFSRGGYTGLVAIGANPDWAAATTFCQESSSHWCEQIRRKEFPAQPLAHDPRIKAAVTAHGKPAVIGRQNRLWLPASLRLGSDLEETFP
jgi:predicted dienelactone hydrolase